MVLGSYVTVDGDILHHLGHCCARSPSMCGAWGGAEVAHATVCRKGNDPAFFLNFSRLPSKRNIKDMLPSLLCTSSWKPKAPSRWVTVKIYDLTPRNLPLNPKPYYVGT